MHVAPALPLLELTMSTLNGVGTLYYDWKSNDDGTANATRWFVVFFLPVLPIRRERVRVGNTEVKRSGVLDTILAATGNGSGFETEIEVLERAPNSLFRILKTYLLAYVGVPMATFVLPVAILLGLMMLTDALGFDVQNVMRILVPVFGILVCLWIGIFVASILDRTAGRKHVAEN
ncbi:MAG: hypothetical protein Rhob2KO_53640 [Rhodopirellula baltica]